MSKHTPGPWKISKNSWLASRRAVVSIHYPVFRGKTWGNWIVSAPGRRKIGYSEVIANTCLIAAAPDLLEAAKYALRSDSHDRLERLAGAVAKAEGEL